MPESKQKKLERVRPPKVQISYEVETLDAVVKKELPFVMGVLADLSGDNEVKDARGRPMKITERKFSHIDRDNFNTILKSSKPKATFRVADKLSGEDGKTMSIDLEFQHMEDFHPEKIAEKIDPLRKLMEARRRLASLKQKMDGNTDLENSLNEILRNVDLRQQVKSSLDADENNSGNSQA
ncbi:MAG TPA: type VI secretion system contractile sheath small subunit [Chitinispirillaceae bacterium]|nr:type VI secretion system contractile sheath small subunit [Chitinispirillaceae bacterium]